MLGLALLAAAGLALAVGANLYSAHLHALALELRVSALAVSLLIAGAEVEELATAVVASGRGKPEIAAGDAIGANFTMVTLVLGILAILQVVPITRRLRVYVAGACAVSAGAAAVLSVGGVSRIDGALLVSCYVAFFGFVLVREHSQSGAVASSRTSARTSDVARRDFTRRWVLALVGLGLVMFGGWLAVEGAVRLASATGITGGALGLTLVALATSAELFALMWAARRYRISELAVAALVGSVVANATATLGVAALIQPISTDDFTGPAWATVVLVAMMLVTPLWHGRTARLTTGAVLVIGYILYLALVL